MKEKKKSGIASLLPIALSCILLGAGSLWLIVGLIVGIVNNFSLDVIKPIFWILSSSLFVVGLTLLIIFKVKEKKEN